MNISRKVLVLTALFLAAAISLVVMLTRGDHNEMAGMSHDTAASSSSMQGMDHSSMGASGAMTDHSAMSISALVEGADGTSATAGGLTLTVDPEAIPASAATDVMLHVQDGAGKNITNFEVENTKKLHLIVAKNDLSVFQHLHPALDSSGMFMQSVRLKEPGEYKLIADFVTSGKRYVLSRPLTVRGSAASDRPLPAEVDTTSVDGYKVSLNRGGLTAGKDADLKFTISKDGKLIRKVQPYLGALGHLVVLKEGSLKYLHAHPTVTKLRNGVVRFAADLPEAGGYRAFLQFQTGGKVRTVAYTLAAK